MSNYRTWRCPFCGQNATITPENESEDSHYFYGGEKHGNLVITTKVILCPNGDCGEYTVTAGLHEVKHYPNTSVPMRRLLSWQLRPRSKGRTFPSYVPEPILRDYEEACLIRDLSPKASATLSRRCLQGIIRDFWQIRKERLFDEIKELNGKIDPEVWAAIDAVRNIGNIGAHMEKDINLIIDVDPHEAELLCGLIEMLLKDWYVARHDREERLRSIVDIAKAKTEAKSEAVP